MTPSGQDSPGHDTLGESLPLDPARFRLAMGRFATGVVVLTTVAGGHDHAMTANSLTSVSLDPLLVLVCVEEQARFLEAVHEAGVWGVSVLPASARAAAAWLAVPGRPVHGQLAQIPHHRGPATGVALLDGALAHLECRTRQIVPAGDHEILVADVLGLALPEQTEPALLFYRGRFSRVD